MAFPIVTLTTDFGVSDHYVGTMKGVILSRCDECTIVDISHCVPAYSILAGAYTIAQAAPYFPPGTVHTVVVDPGVGTERRAIAVLASGQFFVAPDNGVLSFILARSGAAEVWHVTNEDVFLEHASATFHGRDVFAPVAAALVAGTKPAKLGPRIHDPVLLPEIEPRDEAGKRTGCVLSVDHFGNVITNLGLTVQEVQIGGKTVRARYRTFEEAPEGELFLYAGSSGFLEIGMKQARAADPLRVRPGDLVTARIDV